ncbi:WASH complex subunit 1 [Nephila pilipes]|uniref:WASH complex subunit 1 n=1 Tax=Nephila pilipes TaxID=299642 RepID=A0A8X6TSL8_NEPPI|nr:WASH complex subunit 1 [Nephila pilipes]
MQAYELQLIPPDLRREEAMIQIADSLDYMQKITDSIFKKILDRVSDYNKRLQSVCDRADIAQKKIDKIRGSSKATKVFSSCKYPGDENLDDYKILFTNDHGLKGKQTSSYHVKSKHVTPDERILKQKLQFYNVRVPERQREKNQMLEEGLGSLPKRLDSLSTLLLFNTSENP